MNWNPFFGLAAARRREAGTFENVERAFFPPGGEKRSCANENISLFLRRETLIVERAPRERPNTTFLYFEQKQVDLKRGEFGGHFAYVRSAGNEPPWGVVFQVIGEMEKSRARKTLQKGSKNTSLSLVPEASCVYYVACVRE